MFRVDSMFLPVGSSVLVSTPRTLKLHLALGDLCATSES